MRTSNPSLWQRNFQVLLKLCEMAAAAGAGAGKEKEPPNEVHQNAIFRETVAKEMRHQKLFTKFTFNPHNDYSLLADKPNSKVESRGGVEDEEFLKIYRRSLDVPNNKYELPLTSNHEIGWDTQPLIEHMKDDVRIHHPRHHSEITTYMAAYWKQKEQMTMQQ